MTNIDTDHYFQLTTTYSSPTNKNKTHTRHEHRKQHTCTTTHTQISYPYFLNLVLSRIHQAVSKTNHHNKHYKIVGIQNSIMDCLLMFQLLLLLLLFLFLVISLWITYNDVLFWFDHTLNHHNIISNALFDHVHPPESSIITSQCRWLQVENYHTTLSPYVCNSFR